jgi:hypothetical protein
MKKVINGDILNARGDVFPASGKKNATGDFFNGEGDLTPTQQAAVDNYFKTQAELEKDMADYSKAYDKKESGGVLNTIDRILGLADKSADIYNKVKTGTSVEDEGFMYDVEAGYGEQKKDNTIWYIAGGVVVLLIVVGVVLNRKK